MTFSAALVAVCCASGPVIFVHAATAPMTTAAASSPRFSENQILEAWGWLTAHEQNLAGIELNENERAAFLRGASTQFKGGPAPFDLSAIYSDVEKLAETRREKIALALKQKQRAEAEGFFAALQKKAGVVRLRSGLRYEIAARGEGPLPRPQQTVNVHYTGRLIDGTEFVQFGPYDVVLVPNRVSAALFEGLQKVGAGGRITLYVPPPLSAGEETRLGIPPGSATIYEVEVFAVKETAPDDLANALLPPAPEPPPPPPSRFTELQQIETWGWTAAQKVGGAAFVLSDAARDAFLKGFSDGVANLPPAFDLNKIRPEVRSFVAGQRENRRLALQKKRRDEMNTLFTELKKNPDVVELSDGLRYQILQRGAGPYPKPGEIVIVEYTGRLLDGSVFDRTDNEPLHIEVGSVVAGWNEGIQKINRGGRIKLYVPPSLGYGNENMSGVISSIPASSTLIYEITLLDIQEATPEDGPPSPAKPSPK